VRQRALLVYALGALRRRGGRNVAIAVGVGFVVMLFGSVMLMTSSLRREYELTIEATPDLTVQRMVGGRPALIDAASIDALAARPGVREVRPRVWGYLFVEALGANLTVVGDGADFPAELVDGSPAPEPGRVPRVVVGEALADALGLRAGDRLAIPRHDGETVVLEVAGVFAAEAALHSADVLVADDDTARALLGVPAAQVTDVALLLSTPDEASVVAAAAMELVDGARVLDRRALERTYELSFDGRAGMLSVALLPALAALLLLAWERLSGLSAAERREIGVLKAVGWSTGDVLVARLWESTLVAAGGAWSGALLAYAYVYWLGAPGLRGALFGWSTLYPELRLVPALDLAEVFSLLGLVVLPFAAISVVPAWRAATLDPDRAMRGAG